MHGIYLINKPKGITSHDVVGYLRKITDEKTIGHAGTLDPLASGLMIVAIGREFTKRISEFSKLDKEYMAEATLGATSTTYDAEGEITITRHFGLSSRHSGESRECGTTPESYNNKSIRSWTSQDDGLVKPSLAEIESILQSFVGEQEQMPPIFSAKKIKGQKAYDLARQGKPVDLKAVPVIIYQTELIDYQYPILKFRVKVSSGTYIRSLVHDLGQKLGLGAYMSGLIRTSIGNYDLVRAIDLHQISSLADLTNAKIKL